MAKNDYLSRQRAMEQEVFDAGLRIGRQQMCDYLTLALRDPGTMGKDTFSGKRIIKVINKINDLMASLQAHLKSAMKQTITRKNLTVHFGKLTAMKFVTVSSHSTNDTKP